MSNFAGMWVGYTEGTETTSRLYANINGNAQRLTATVLALRSDGIGEVYELVGKENSATEATFQLVRCVVDYHNLTMPSSMSISIKAKPDVPELDIKWASDIGTLGTARLSRAKGIANLVTFLPFALHATYRYIKRLFRKYFRVSYLMFTVVLAVLSISGRTPEKINATEAVLLVIPLAYLFRDKIYELIFSMRLRKAGPFEFYEQRVQPAIGNVDQVDARLRNEFGEKFSSLQTVARFLVPRTMYLLRVLDHFDRPIGLEEFRVLARGVGVPAENIRATHEALIVTNCLDMKDQGEVVVSEFGHLLLKFERRANELLTGSV